MKKFSTTITLVAALALSTSAFATGNGGKCNGGSGGVFGDGGDSDCSVDKRHHYNNTTDNSTTNKAFGGDGGTGGDGGDAKAYGGIGFGGSVKDSGNSDNHNLNTIIIGGGGEGQGGDTLSPKQKQKQSQFQAQSASAKSGSTSKVSGNNSASEVSVDASDRSVTLIEGDEAQKRNPVASAWAAPLVASNDTCMGSTSAGGQGITIGFSFATTWRDRDCVTRKDARFLHNMQLGNVALSLMCSKEAVLTAVTLAGTDEEKAACGITE